MADDIKLVISGDSAGAVAAIKQTNDALGGLSGQHLPNINKGLANTNEALGMSRREWMRTGHEAAFYMTMIAGKTGEVGKSISAVTGVATQLGESLMYGGAIGISIGLIGTAVSLVASKIQEARRDADDFTSALVAMGRGDATTGALVRLAGVTEQQAKAALEAAKNNAVFRDSLIELSKAAADAADPLKQVAVYTDLEAAELGGLVPGIDAATRATDARTEAQKKLNDAIRDGIQRQKDIAGAEDQFARDKKRRAAEFVVEEDKRKQALKDSEDGAKRYAEALQKVAEAQNSILKGVVEKALSPTTVTDTDMAAAALGKYTNKWDEFRRRLEDVAKGVDPSKYGADFAKMFSSLGMSAEQAATKFKDFSLFADPKNLKLVDWSAFTADVGNQLMGLVGKANLMKEGFAKAWASLSKDQRASLRELGIESAGDAKKVLMGAADSGVAGFVGQLGDKETKKKLVSGGNTIVQQVQAGMTDKDTLKTWQNTFTTLVDSGVGYLGDKDIVKKLNLGGKSILGSLAEGVTQGEDKPLNDALIKACDDAIQAAIDKIKSDYGLGGAATPGGGATVVPSFASGGIGTFARGGLVRVDAGERFWFSGARGDVPPPGSGATVIVQYSPQISLATKDEAETVIAPYVRAAVRDATRRGAL
jgi:hypothetical protein